MLADLRQRALELIADLHDGRRDDARRDALLCELLAVQRQQVTPYARLCRHRQLTDRPILDPGQYPALPTDVFRFSRVASHGPDRDVRVFKTSGTTQGTRGHHHVSDLRTYDAAARSMGQHALFGDVARMRLLILAPHENELADSSLSYMLSRFVEWFGDAQSTFVWHAGALDVALLRRELDRACADGVPVALLGTSFAFVHAEDHLVDARWALPTRSRLMQTGGYKGRSREVEPEALRDALAQRYGVDAHHMVQEYGMTELCSQMYESGLIDARADQRHKPRRLVAPGWVRVTAVDPETLLPVPRGEIGIARIDDVANVDTVCAIQTADRIREVDDGFALLGRAPGSTPRGCSLAIEESLG